VVPSEPHPRPKLELSLTIRVSGIDVQRLAEFRLPTLQPGKEVETRHGAVQSSLFDGIAHSLDLGDVW
jgi:hypothetical protein